MLIHGAVAKFAHISEQHCLRRGIDTEEVHQCCAHAGRVGVIGIDDQGVALCADHLRAAV